MYFENEIRANKLISCSLCSYRCIMIISLFVDIYMSMCWGFPSEIRIFEFQEFHSDLLGKSYLYVILFAHI